MSLAIALLVAACGAATPHGVIHPRVYKVGAFAGRPCDSAECAQYAAALRWSVSWDHTTTGYYLYVNRIQKAEVSAPSWVVPGMACGRAYTVGVQARDSAGHLSQEYTTTFTTPACVGPTVNYYVAQTPAGLGNATSCANAAGISTLSTPGEWTPGNVIGLCGTITSNITAHGSGGSGDPITLYFEPGAKLSEPVCTPACLTLSHQRYITVDGGTDGIIENTANGTGRAHSVASDGIVADPCDGCTLENLTIRNIYVHTSPSDSVSAAGNTGGLDVSGSALTVAHNTIDNVRGGVYIDEEDKPTDSNLQFYGNDIYDTDYGFWLAFANNSGGARLGPFYIYDNHIHDHRMWDTTSDTFHHDGVMVYSSGSPATDVGGGVYVYDNQFDGTSGIDATGDVFLPGSSEGDQIAAETNIYIFNDIFDHTDNAPGNGTLVLHAGHVRVWNNTLVQPNNTANSGLDLNDGGTLELRNNLFVGGNILVRDLATSAVTLSPAPDYDFFANGGSNAFVCDGYFGFPSGLAHWRACTGGERHGTAYTGRFTLNRDGSLPDDSPAAGKGENLYGTCRDQPNPGLGALCDNITGAVRPTSGAWNPGAY